MSRHSDRSSWFSLIVESPASNLVSLVSYGWLTIAGTAAVTALVDVVFNFQLQADLLNGFRFMFCTKLTRSSLSRRLCLRPIPLASITYRQSIYNIYSSLDVMWCDAMCCTHGFSVHCYRFLSPCSPCMMTADIVKDMTACCASAVALVDWTLSKTSAVVVAVDAKTKH